MAGAGACCIRPKKKLSLVGVAGRIEGTPDSDLRIHWITESEEPTLRTLSTLSNVCYLLPTYG